MGKVNGRFVILLDVGKVLSVDEIASLTGVSAPVAMNEMARGEA